MAVTAEQMGAPRRTLMWITGAFLSMFLFAAVIALSYSLGAREGGFGDPPLVRAPQGPYKIVPEQPGGQSFPHQNIGVYDRVSGEQTVSVEQLLPPTEQPLDPRSVPRTAPRVIDQQAAEADAQAGFSPPAPTQPEDGVSPTLSEDGNGGLVRNIPRAETVTEGTIADLIRQNTSADLATGPEIPAAAAPPSTLEPGDGLVEVVMAVTPPPQTAPVIAPSSRLEPVIAEEVVPDPARVVDGTQLPVPPADIGAEISAEIAAEIASREMVQDTGIMAPETVLETAMEAAAPSIPMPVTKPAAAGAPQTARAAPDTAPESDPAPATQIAALALPEPQTAKAVPEDKAPKVLPAGAFVVQIGAFRKKAEAEAAWRRAARTHKDLVAQLRPAIQRADLGKRGIYFRLRIGPLDNKAQARSLCKLLIKRDQPCLVPKL